MLNSQEKKGTMHWAWLVTIIIVGAAGVWFRAWQLPIQLLADDEWHALNKLIKSDAWGIFTSFGRADHSIPVTLYYYAISQITPLTENIMRFPMLLAGLALPVTAPWLMRRILSRPEQAVLFILLTLSPILIYYTRTARPYALSTLLAFAAVICFYVWVQKPKLIYALSYLTLCSLCAWMQPVTLALLLSPFVFYGLKSIHRWAKHHDKRLFIRLLGLGLAQLSTLTVLLGPPVYYSINDIAGKTGVDSPTVHSVIETLKLLTGSKYALYMGIFIGFSGWGVLILSKRQRELTLYLVICSALSLGAILCSGAAWIQHPLVTARYCLPMLPIMAIFASVGLSNTLRFSLKHSPMKTPLIIAIPVLVYLSGPLAQTYSGPINQFTGHMGYQFDYNWKNNTYNKVLDNRPISSFYYQLGQEPEKSLQLVIAPWFLEWHYNRWYIDQAVHNQLVAAGFVEGFCGKLFYGEYSKNTPQVKLTNAVHVTALAEKSRGYDYFIYHKSASRIDQNVSKHQDCEAKVLESFGKPTYEDDQILAYKLDEAK
ncbi:hypothetical protein [Gilvimarinus xylanilyticus]|uniref:Uncharacterized protein n=1 Tax=Gilvimarinus xylanilyticus TaxID=2944139 RepID=A0A9X2I2Z7_9GAMM|nr:hypothetical protein [Gilvimarinus xylanilyticus]MCP8899375.1 hypothetical protein [Gilvimarinus xylanilyticus]